jgi:UDP-N-acetylmuramate-alanine ligase
MDTLYCNDLTIVAELLEHLSDDSDAILVLGAGDVGLIIDTLRGGLS